MTMPTKTVSGVRKRVRVSRPKKADLKQQIERLETMKCELEATAESLKLALETAAHDSRSKSHYLATMSHELRTPLNAIIGFSEILKDEIFGPIGSARYRDYAANIHRSGAYLLNLINDLLDMAKLDAGKFDLSESAVDVGKTIADCVDLMEPQARKSKVTLSAAPCTQPFVLRCDERRVRQILLNLLSNAVKFTPEGGEVKVSAGATPDGFAIVIADTGIGIALEDIPRALERFGQIDSALSRKHQGTGLGLPLAKTLIELHGGRLSIASEVGVGTKVMAMFPLARLIAARDAA
jgi:signal transduction histidine kinase